MVRSWAALGGRLGPKSAPRGLPPMYLFRWAPLKKLVARPGVALGQKVDQFQVLEGSPGRPREPPREPPGGHFRKLSCAAPWRSEKERTTLGFLACAAAVFSFSWSCVSISVWRFRCESEAEKRENSLAGPAFSCYALISYAGK